jgi:hypothetical protein
VGHGDGEIEGEGLRWRGHGEILAQVLELMVEVVSGSRFGGVWWEAVGRWGLDCTRSR